MKGVWKLLCALAIAALLASALASCGGGDSGDSTSASTGETGAAGKSEGREGSASFRTAGGDNSVQNFGEEADEEEADAANTALDDYLRARAEGNWDEQCEYLAKATLQPLEQLFAKSQQVKGSGCAATLAAFGSGAPASTRVDTLTGSGIASLRAEDKRAFALYHGTHGVDYFISMSKEDGEWKVAALSPTELR
jgi:hypothetical protein